MVRIRVLLVLLVATVALAPLFGSVVDAKNRHPVARVDADAVRSTVGDPGDVTDRYIVAVAKNAPDPGTVANRLASNLGIQVSHVYRHGFRGFAAKIAPDVLPQVRKNANVRSVEPDEPITVSSAVQAEAAPEMLAAGAQEVPDYLKRIGATRNSVAQIDGVDQRVDVTVAVIDTGIDRSTADWDMNLVGGYNCAPDADSTDVGWDSDGYSHGTSVAGIIGALDNDHGSVGVAPGANLWSVKVFDARGRGSTSTLLCGLNFVNDNIGGGAGIQVVNMSLGTSPGKKVKSKACTDGMKDDLHLAICSVVDGGATVVAAAGNDATKAKRVKPGAYAEVVTVSAFKIVGPGEDRFAGFSNFGGAVTLSAPGVSVEVLVAGQEFIGSADGTSFSAPQVSGAAALAIAGAGGSMSPADVRAKLLADREQVHLKKDPDKRDEGVVNVADPGSRAP